MTDWNNKKEVLEAVKEDGTKLENASEELRNDKEVVIIAVENGYKPDFVDKSIKSNSETLPKDNSKTSQQIKEFFSEGSSDYFYDLDQVIQDHIMNDPEYVIKLMRVYDEGFEFYSDVFEGLPKKIRDNLDVMKVAVELNPRSIEYMSNDSINSELFKIIIKGWKNDYKDEGEIYEFREALTTSSCSEDNDLIKYLINEISSGEWGATSLPFGLISACSSTLFKDKDILLGLLKNLNEEVNSFLCNEEHDFRIYGGNDYYFHWTEVISCEHFSKKMQGSGLLKDPDIIDLLKNISIGIEKHFTLMRKENSMHWVENNEDKHWIMLFRELSKG